MSTVGVVRTPDKPPKPDNPPVAIADLVPPGTINVFAMTVWLISEQPSNPMGRNIVVAAADPDTAREFVSNFYGADLQNWNGPTQMIHNAFLALADGTGVAAPKKYEQRHLHQHEEPQQPEHDPTKHAPPAHDAPEPHKQPPSKQPEPDKPGHEQKAAVGSRRLR